MIRRALLYMRMFDAQAWLIFLVMGVCVFVIGFVEIGVIRIWAGLALAICASVFSDHLEYLRGR